MDSPTETRLENSEDSCGYPQNSNSFAEISTDHNSSSSPETPKSDRIPVALSFGSVNSDVTPNHDSDSSYSELDSEAEAFYSSLNHHLVSPGTMESHDLAEKHISYGELMKKFLQCEEELKTMSLKLQDSEQEIEKLKGETEKKDSAVLLAENLRVELEATQREIEMRETEIETEKRRVLELQGQVVDLETKLSESSFKIENLVNELEVTRECLDVSDAEISKLREMLCDCEQTFSTELLEKQTFFEAQIKELESRGEVLEDQIKHSDAKKMEMESKEVQLQGEINALKTDLSSRNEHTEALNKDFDKHKLRFDMLMAEKDGVIAELDNLKAELKSRDIQIEQMEEHKLRYDMLMAEKDGVYAELDNLKAEMRSKDIQIEQMRCKQTELVSESGIAKSTVEELRAMVKELEKQAELQRNVISEGEEEKREAIRQLCFSLDHYKSGYRELLRFLSSNHNKQQQAIMVV